MSDSTVKILGKEIERGESSTLELEVAKLHTRNSIHIPIIVERAEKDGPVILLLGGIHGDEINGVAIVRRLIKEKKNIPLCGTVIAIPVFNVFGYLNLTREFPDGRDLNRVFPGSEKGSLASQFAHKFTQEIAPAADYIIDFHTGGAERENIPQVRCAIQDSKALEAAKIFNAPFILHSKFVPKSVRESMTKMGKTVLLYEGGKSKSVNQNVIECGFQGTLNLMGHLGMQNGQAENQNKSLIVSKSRWIRAPYSGMLHLKIENGAFIKKKTLMCYITDPYGEFEKKVLAPADCHVICVNTAPVVNRGDALFNISTETVE